MKRTVVILAVLALLPAVVSSHPARVQILGWRTEYADIDQEYANTLEAISKFFSDYSLTETDTDDPSVLREQLRGKNVFLIPELENAGSSVLDIASSWAPVLQDFVRSGGTVIFCEERGDRRGFISKTGLMEVSYISRIIGSTLKVVKNHPITSGVSASFLAPDATSCYEISTPDVVPLITSSEGKPVVAIRDFGKGHVVLLGFDYFAYNDDTARLIANAVQYSSVTAVQKVLILKDVDPWGFKANEEILTELEVNYDIATSADIGRLNLKTYDVVLVASDQPTTFYDSLAYYQSKFEDFVANGGVLEFHAAGWGHHDGDASKVVLPGGMRIEYKSAGTNYILDPGHPIVAGMPDTFTGDNASHAHFLDIPKDAREIVGDGVAPNLVEYSFGLGTVIASGQTLEWGYEKGQGAGTILANMISYALSKRVGIPSTLKVTITGIDVSDFPKVEVSATVLDHTGRPISGLKEVNFKLMENEVSQSILVRESRIEGGSKVDIIFVFDDTGSMDDEIATLKRQVGDFLSKLASSGVDYALGLTTFKDDYTIYNDGELISDPTVFQMLVDTLTATGGDDVPENALDALGYSARQFKFRSGTQRIFILITDAPFHTPGSPGDAGKVDFSYKDVLQELTSKHIVCHVVGPTNTGGYDRTFESLESIPKATGGNFYPITKDFSGIIDTIGEVISSTYIIVYTTSNPARDCTTRKVCLRVTYNDSTGEATSTYVVPCVRKIALPDTVAYPGDILGIPLDVSDATGIAGIEATVSFDPSVLEAIDVDSTSLTEDFVLADTISPGQVKFSLARATGLGGGSGALAEIIFKVVGSPGDSTGLVLDKIALYDENTEEIPVSRENGSVKVESAGPVRIEISPDTVVVEIGSRQEFSCKGYDSENREVSVTPLWKVEPSELGEISSGGLFSGTGKGKGLVIAEVNGLRDSSVVWVGEKGDMNLDGLVDVRDGIICLRLVAGLLLPPKPLHEATVYEEWASDISRDGEVTAGDALLILYKGLGRPVPKIVMASGIAYVMMEEEGGCSRLVVEGRRDIYAAEVWLRGIDLREVRPVRKDVMWVENRKAGEVRAVLVGLGGILGDGGEMLEVFGEGVEVENVRLFGVSGQELGVLLEGREFGDLRVYPNPFNGVLHVRYVVGDVGKVGIYDVLGRLVRDWRVGFGEGELEWDGRDRFGRFVSSGVYFVRLEVGDISRTKKVVFVR